MKVIMLLFLLTSLLLFAKGPIHNMEAKTAQCETSNSYYDGNQGIAKAFLITISNAQVDSEQHAPYDPRKDCLYRLYLIATILGVLGGIAGIIVLIRQTNLLEETVESAGHQSQTMELHIKEAARSANAMEAIANKIEDGNQMIMRAYVTTVIGGAIFQEHRVGQSDLKFEGKVEVRNTGNTPACKVRIQKKADILPNPVPDDFSFLLPPSGEQEPTYAAIGAHQSYVIESIVSDFMPDADVASIKEGAHRALVMWGSITYEDIFGKPHCTNFAHLLYWQPGGKVFGYYLPGQNEAD